MTLPRTRPGNLSPAQRLIVEQLTALHRIHGTILSLDHLRSITTILTKETYTNNLESLKNRGYILLSINHVALTSHVRKELKKETDRLRNRKRRSSPQSFPSENLQSQLSTLFGRPRRITRAPTTASYLTPLAFVPLIQEHLTTGGKSCHRNQRPGHVQEIAGPWSPSELGGLIQCIAEQTAAHREVWIIYTRKNAYIGTAKRGVIPQ